MADKSDIFVKEAEVSRVVSTILDPANSVLAETDIIRFQVEPGDARLAMDLVFTQMEGVKNLSYKQTGVLEAYLDSGKNLDAAQVGSEFMTKLRENSATYLASDINNLRDTREKFVSTAGMGNAMNDDTVNMMFQLSMEHAAKTLNKDSGGKGHGSR